MKEENEQQHKAKKSPQLNREEETKVKKRKRKPREIKCKAVERHRVMGQRQQTGAKGMYPI